MVCLRQSSHGIFTTEYTHGIFATEYTHGIFAVEYIHGIFAAEYTHGMFTTEYTWYLCDGAHMVSLRQNHLCVCKGNGIFKEDEEKVVGVG